MATQEERLAAVEAALAPTEPKQPSAGHQSSEFKTTITIVAAGIFLVAAGVYLTASGDKETGHMLIQEGMPMLTILGTVYAGGRTAVKVFKKE